MFEEMIYILRSQLQYDIAYFNKYGIKSAMLQRAMNVLNMDDEDLKCLKK